MSATRCRRYRQIWMSCSCYRLRWVIDVTRGYIAFQFLLESASMGAVVGIIGLLGVDTGARLLCTLSGRTPGRQCGSTARDLSGAPGRTVGTGRGLSALMIVSERLVNEKRCW